MVRYKLEFKLMDNSDMEAAVAEYVALRAYETSEMNL